MRLFLSIALICIVNYCIYGQSSQWNQTKPGAWHYESNLPSIGHKLRNGNLSTEENLTFKKNISTLVEWFRQQYPMLNSPCGYDLRAISSYVWSDYTTKTDYEYAIPGEISFLFELFHADGSKWKIEPPQFRFEVIAVSGGHDGFYFSPEYMVNDGSRYDQTVSEKVDSTLQILAQYFRVYPFKESPCAGIDVYQAYRDGWQENGIQTIVVYNPQRPPYWLPVTVQEMADAHLAYYSLFQKKEIDRMILDQLKLEIAELTPEELAAPAYAGYESHFVLKVNGKKQGYQIMRFNPAYWDKSLPISAIQFLTFRNENLTDGEMLEQKQRAYPNYPQLFFKQIKWDVGLVGLVMQK
jgi:hypothetical protein